MRLPLMAAVLSLSVCSPAYALVVDLTNLSALPLGVTASGSVGNSDFIVNVDGMINTVTVQSQLTVNGVPTDFDGSLIMGTVYFSGPDVVALGYEVNASIGQPTVLDVTPLFDRHGIFYTSLRATPDYVFAGAQLFSLANYFGVPESAIRYNYVVTSIDYTPANVPEPSTLLLSGLGALLWLRPTRRVAKSLLTISFLLFVTSSPAYATVVDLMNLSALPAGVTVSGSFADDNYFMEVDGTRSKAPPSRRS